MPSAFNYFSLMTVKWFSKVSKPLFEHLEKRGCLVVYWVLNNEKDWEKAINVN